jgi:PPM family protein phosphatase
VRITAAGLTDTGCARENNEDAFLADDKAGLFLVADGMGGLEAGEVASRLAVDTVAELLLAFGALGRPGQTRELETKLVLAYREANTRILDQAHAQDTPASMGATLVGLALLDGQFVLANVGDSRAYLIRSRTIRQLSQDHSLVMAKVRQGLMSQMEASASPEKNLIYRALGLSAHLEVDTSVITAEPGDAFLLCSDGLSDVLADQDILDMAGGDGRDSPEAICASLIAAALERQARDNVTAVLIRCLP